MLVLGIDPGFDRMGYGVIEEVKGKYIYHTAGSTETKKTKTESERFLDIYNATQDLLTTYKPDYVAVESLFFATNAKTAISVGGARGVILLACAIGKRNLVSYSPLEVKLAVTGYGRAEKSQVQQMIKTILHLPVIPKPDDAADALGIALTHCFSYKIKQL